MAADLSRRGLFRALTGTPRGPSETGSAISAARIARIGAACVEPRGVTCRRCGEACEASAIRFRPLGVGKSAALLDSGLCTGCAACLSVCPTSAITMVLAERAALVAGLAEMRSVS